MNESNITSNERYLRRYFDFGRSVFLAVSAEQADPRGRQARSGRQLLTARPPSIYCKECFLRGGLRCKRSCSLTSSWILGHAFCDTLLKPQELLHDHIYGNNKRTKTTPRSLLVRLYCLYFGTKEILSPVFCYGSFFLWRA